MYSSQHTCIDSSLDARESPQKTVLAVTFDVESTKPPRPGFTGNLKEDCVISFNSVDGDIDINTVKIDCKKYWVF